MKLRRSYLTASMAIGLMAASVPASAGTPGFCPQVDSQYHSFFWYISHHLPLQAMKALFGSDGVCSRH
jgi:hypothetical protein